MLGKESEFIKGNIYRVVKAFAKFSQNFCEGHKLRLVDEGYSRYDGLKIYAFEDVVSGEKISLEITDDESIQDWRVMFEECEM